MKKIHLQLLRNGTRTLHKFTVFAEQNATEMSDVPFYMQIMEI